MHRFLTVFLATLVTMAVAGCLDNHEGVTERSRLGTAEQMALHWDPDAVLMELVGLDGLLEDADGADAGFDPNATVDGHAQTWTYSFEADGRGYVVVIAANGTVLLAQETEPEGGLPLTSWALDSGDAFDVVLQANATAKRAVENGSVQGAAYILQHDDGAEHPTWSVGLFGEDTWMIHLVDAVNGTYLGAFGLDNLLQTLFLPDEGAETSGSLDPLTNSVDLYAFEVLEEGHPRIRFQMQTQTTGSLDGLVHVTLTDPAGTTVEQDVPLATPAGFASTMFTLEDVPVGVWDARFELQGTAVNTLYSFAWCADGLFGLDGDFFGPCSF